MSFFRNPRDVRGRRRHRGQPIARPLTTSGLVLITCLGLLVISTGLRLAAALGFLGN